MSDPTRTSGKIFPPRRGPIAARALADGVPPNGGATPAQPAPKLPATETIVLIHSALVTWPPAKMVTYADASKSRGITTMPPSALML